ncbi:MAG: hypothetical protein A3K19_10230 [Lentisphaerae bacterium RIFOXYB12_FULL_65_16]|nr:MAG: hypothetical protein A3K18_32090 [Lentisphaerae bacterium RIFOXYA12_64_32]OGV91593.1 MAG: hypothetical protein A3K19_10230 [Lentisphaerae bacterium RIFOXYB12_FULL_65_16]
MGEHKHRPDGTLDCGARHFPQLSRELDRELTKTFARLQYPSLRLSRELRRELVNVLVEFAEDIHCRIGMWRSLEEYNERFFGVRLPFLPASDTDGISRSRVQHLLWGTCEALVPNLLLSPTHADLCLLADVTSAFLSERCAAMPPDSAVASFLRTSNVLGWEVKRKLVWMGQHSYLFRTLCGNYVRAQGGKASIPVLDDFLCQQTTLWSGLGVVDILAGTLDITPEQRSDLRGWYERHGACYRVAAVEPPFVRVVNMVNGKPYAVRMMDEDAARFVGVKCFVGSLVPWNGDWYASGEQQVFSDISDAHIEESGRDILRRCPTIAYRYCKDLSDKAMATIRCQFDAFVARHGDDLVVFPDGLALAADWQRAGREQFAARSPDEVQATMKRHGLENPWPRVSLPDALLNHENGIGVFDHPTQGQEIMQNFNAVVAAMRKRGRDLNATDLAMLRGVITDRVISPEYVQRLVRDHGADSILSAFLLPRDCGYSLDVLLRRYKGAHFRNRYPNVTFT